MHTSKTDLRQGSLDQAAETAALEKELAAAKRELESERSAKEHLQLLASATRVLIGEELDYEKRLKDLGDVIVPTFADWCAIRIVQGKPSYTIITSASPEKRAVADEIQRKYPPRLEFNYGISDVVKRVQPRLYPHISDELMRQTTQNEEHFRLFKKIGIHSVIMTPLVARSRVLGGITFALSSGEREYTEKDLDLAVQLTNRAAISLENAMLHEELAEANRAKEKFLAMLAHELRNPLTPIRNSLPILAAKGDDDPELKDIAEVMERQIRIMSRLLDDLFDVSRITEGKIQFRMEDVDLLTVVRQTVNHFRPEMERKGFKFSSFLADGPFMVHADKVRMEQVLVNLLNNAMKYTPSGGRIAVECEREDDHAVIRVKDSGKGIPAYMLQKIFQLFIQVEQSIDRPEGGLGLGLTLVKMLVERHGGAVQAISEGIGKGSEFIVRLPLIAAVKEEEKKGDDHPHRLVQDTARRILIVDDNEDAANSIGKLLRKLGHETEVTYDGLTALDLAKEFKPEVVLLDLGLPLLDGYATAQRFREVFPQRDRLLLVAISGYGQEEDRRRTAASGFDFHLVKPFDTQELRGILNAWKPG